MKFYLFLKRDNLRIAIVSLILTCFVIQGGPAFCSETEDLPRLTWRQISPEGFGDQENNTAWSMKWWNGKLYVGTNRCWFCWSLTSGARKVFYPFLTWLYPPKDPDMECANSWEDMPMQAEIWRWTPETDVWDMCYKSPNDVPNTTYPGKYSSREAGFRGMEIFVEPDGTEALYVTSVWSGMINDGATPPRILRSTDGNTFEAIPQEPGTFLGDFDKSSMRGMLTYNKKFYVIAGTIQGQGTLWEAEDPAGGNDNFRQVSPAGLSIWDMALFNDQIYFGIRQESPFFQPKDKQEGCKGYSVAKTYAAGDPPYTFDFVVTHGAYLPDPAQTTVSLAVLKDALYVGCDKPAEMIRVYADGTWDLVVGTPREAPDGWKYPISGFDAGFGNGVNVHIWRQVNHDGVLYAGTADNTTRYKEYPTYHEAVEYRGGFDLYRSADGWYWEEITITGFGDPFQMGNRSLETSPIGVFVGTNNFWGGCVVWQGMTPKESSRLMMTAGGAERAGKVFLPPPSAPRRLEAEAAGESVVLSWAPPDGAGRFHVYRADWIEGPPLVDGYPGPYAEIGATDKFYFVDRPGPGSRRCRYIVKAEHDDRRLSEASNFVIHPSLAPAQKFADLKERVEEMAIRGKFASPQIEQSFLKTIEEVEVPLSIDQLDETVQRLSNLHRELKEKDSEVLDSPFFREMEIRFDKLIRRIRLAQAGAISPDSLN